MNGSISGVDNAEKSPDRIASVGTNKNKGVEKRRRFASKSAKKKVCGLSPEILGSFSGPPRLPPNVLKALCGLSSVFHTRASSASFCMYSNALPWNWSEPLLVLIVTSPTWANSALLLNWVTLNSPISSVDGFMFPSAPFWRMFTVDDPSTEYCTCEGSPPPTDTLPLASCCAPGTVDSIASGLVVDPR